MTDRSSRNAALALGAVLCGAALFAAVPAQARVFVGVGVGLPFYGPSYYPPPVYYAPPPVYYAPPPVVYYAPPPPVYYAPSATAPAAAPAPAARQNCREIQSQQMIDGKMQPTRGTACQQPDGTWRFVN